eukprot:gene21957-26913_t
MVRGHLAPSPPPLLSPGCQHELATRQSSYNACSHTGSQRFARDDEWPSLRGACDAELATRQSSCGACPHTGSPRFARDDEWPSLRGACDAAIQLRRLTTPEALLQVQHSLESDYCASQSTQARPCKLLLT